MPILLVPLHEFNPCHTPGGSPQGGQFCSTSGESDAVTRTRAALRVALQRGDHAGQALLARQLGRLLGEIKPARGRMNDITRVGITSQRPPDDPGRKANRDVFQRDMAAFAVRLAALPGVSAVSVQPGLGAWKGGREATWVVSYKGNGQATRLLAETGKRFDQDSVLIMKGCKGSGCSPAVELVFNGGISGGVRDAVHGVLESYRRADGEQIIGGWTWLKRGGKTVLRMVAVPQWGGVAEEHLGTTADISRRLAGLGLTHNVRRKAVRTVVMEREGEHGYAKYLGH